MRGRWGIWTHLIVGVFRQAASAVKKFGYAQPKLEDFNLSAKLPLKAWCFTGRERRLRLVAAAARKPGNPSNTRLTIGRYIADILLDNRQPAAVCHWIVQKIGSAEILQWGQESTFAEAEQAARTYLISLAQRDQKKA